MGIPGPGKPQFADKELRNFRKFFLDGLIAS
jgi:hypothetical protein